MSLCVLPWYFAVVFLWDFRMFSEGSCHSCFGKVAHALQHFRDSVVFHRRLLENHFWFDMFCGTSPHVLHCTRPQNMWYRFCGVTSSLLLCERFCGSLTYVLQHCSLHSAVLFLMFCDTLLQALGWAWVSPLVGTEKSGKWRQLWTRSKPHFIALSLWNSESELRTKLS